MEKSRGKGRVKGVSLNFFFLVGVNPCRGERGDKWGFWEGREGGLIWVCIGEVGGVECEY